MPLTGPCSFSTVSFHLQDKKNDRSDSLLIDMCRCLCSKWDDLFTRWRVLVSASNVTFYDVCRSADERTDGRRERETNWLYSMVTRHQNKQTRDYVQRRSSKCYRIDDLCVDMSLSSSVDAEIFDFSHISFSMDSAFIRSDAEQSRQTDRQTDNSFISKKKWSMCWLNSCIRHIDYNWWTKTFDCLY